MNSPTQFKIKSNDTSRTTAEIIALSKELTLDHVNAFLAILPDLPDEWSKPPAPPKRVMRQITNLLVSTWLQLIQIIKKRAR